MQVYQTDEGGFFVGVTMADPDPMVPRNWLIPGGCVTIAPPAVGDRQRAQWTGDEWVIITESEPDPEPELTPEETLASARAQMRLSFAQMLIGLVSEGWITAEEGRAWRDRVSLPAPVTALIAGLPVDQQFAAETRAMAPSEILRNDPLVAAMGAAEGKTPEQLDQFFTTYAEV